MRVAQIYYYNDRPKRPNQPDDHIALLFSLGFQMYNDPLRPTILHEMPTSDWAAVSYFPLFFYLTSSSNLSDLARIHILGILFMTYGSRSLGHTK